MLFGSSNYVILSGGGARGLAHLEFLKEFRKNIDGMIGVSSGSLVAAAYSYFKGDFERIEEATERIFRASVLEDVEDYFESLSEKNFFNLTQKFFSELKLNRGTSLFDNDSLEEILRDIFGSSHIEDLDLNLYVGAIDLNKGEYVLFNSGEIVPRLLASMAVPMIFPPVRIEESYFVDGGYLENVPVAHSYNLGAKKTYLSDISGSYEGLKEKLRGISMMLNISSIYKDYVNKLERSLATRYMRFTFPDTKWYNFSHAERIRKKARERIKRGFVKGKKISRKRVAGIFEDGKWSIR